MAIGTTGVQVGWKAASWCWANIGLQIMRQHTRKPTNFEGKGTCLMGTIVLMQINKLYCVIFGNF